jgi:hypothetical protein
LLKLAGLFDLAKRVGVAVKLTQAVDFPFSVTQRNTVSSLLGAGWQPVGE